jgi:hypothetical protein
MADGGVKSYTGDAQTTTYKDLAFHIGQITCTIVDTDDKRTFGGDPRLVDVPVLVPVPASLYGDAPVLAPVPANL